MKKEKNKRLIMHIMFLIVVAIITSGLVVYAESTIGINLIRYDNGDGTKSYVKDKLDQLYNSIDCGVGSIYKAKDITANDIGATVTGYKTYTPNDTSKSGTEWQIIYADTNIYLITKWGTTNPSDHLYLNDAISTSKYQNGVTVLSNDSTKGDYPAAVDWFYGWANSSNSHKYDKDDNYQSTLYMLDSSVWNNKFRIIC